MKLCSRMLLVAVACFSLSTQAGEPEDWFLVEISNHRPACENIPANTRCWGTNPDIARFEIRDGETLELPSGSAAPPAWVTFERLWLWAPDVDQRLFSMTLDRTPLGARLIVNDNGEGFVMSLPLNQWTQLDAPSTSAWARISPASH